MIGKKATIRGYRRGRATPHSQSAEPSLTARVEPPSEAGRGALAVFAPALSKRLFWVDKRSESDTKQRYYPAGMMVLAVQFGNFVRKKARKMILSCTK